MKKTWVAQQSILFNDASRFLNDFKTILNAKEVDTSSFSDDALLKIIDFIKERNKYLGDFYENSLSFFKDLRLLKASL